MYLKNIIEVADDIIKDAIKKKASDIHISDVYGKCKIQFRINGILYLENYDKIIPSELISRIKIMSKLNVAEKRIPQDGNIKFSNYDLRVCTMPSISGETVVIRILNTYLKDISLENLGFNEKSISLIKLALNKKNGMILVTGPTGSGKSTTLLSMINILNDGKKKIISIEDPVENKVDGLVQIQVNEDINLGFSEILKSCLRLDPDVIIVSEIRDEITAKIAVRAALTGHLVLATLHTNDAISTFSRLVEMGIQKYLLLDCLLMTISQRLLSSLDDNKIESRALISEVLYLNDEVKNVFSKYDSKDEIIEKIKDKFYTMGDDAIEKGYNI